MGQKHKNTAIRLRQQIEAMKVRHARERIELRVKLSKAALQLASLQDHCIAMVDVKRDMSSGMVQAVVTVSEAELAYVRCLPDFVMRVSDRLHKQLAEYHRVRSRAKEGA